MQSNSANGRIVSDRHQIMLKIKAAFIDIGFEAGQLEEKALFILDSDEGEMRIPIEILVNIGPKPAMLVKCINGSLATRERASLAMARLFNSPPIPFAIVALSVEQKEREKRILCTYYHIRCGGASEPF